MALKYEAVSNSVMANFTLREKADMVFMYGRANGNGREAARLYQESFPNRHQPNHKTFAALFQRLAETGMVLRETPLTDKGRPRTRRTHDFEEAILDHVAENPSVSTRQLAVTFNVDHMTAWRTIHDQLLYPYHLQRVQGLSPADYPQRETFCRWFIHQSANPLFIRTVLFTDEATFGRDGITNLHNQHVWADENPHATFHARHQARFQINVWAGIVGDVLIGPYVLPLRLTGDVYRHFLVDILPELLENVPLDIRTNMWYMHDGAPAHFARPVRAVLDNTYPNKWIGRSGPVAWPPRSPDLNPLDFYLWGHLKALVYAVPINNAEMLRERIFAACESIRNRPGIFERVRQSMTRRVYACIESGGGHFEHLL